MCPHAACFEACAQEFAPALEAEIDRFIAPAAADGIDLEAFELHVRQQALRLAARAVERRLNADLSDGGQRPRECRCCGRQARYAGRFLKTFETVLGPLTPKRAYYHCRACGAGFFPRDASLGLQGTSLSPAVTCMTGSAAALASFRRASELLAELGGLSVCAKRVERVAEALGREITAAESAAVFDREPPAAPTMYLGIDGTGVPMRPKEVAGRAGKQADGSASTREAKLILIWTAAPSATPARQPTRPRSTAPLPATAIPSSPPSPAACGAKPSGAASRRSRAASSSATAPSGFGAWPKNCSRAPSRSWTSTTQPRGFGGLPRICRATIGQPPRRGRRRVARN